MTTGKKFSGTNSASADQLGLIAINENIDVVVGNTPTLLTRPDGCTGLVVNAIAGDWFYKPGKYDGVDPNPAFPDDPTETTIGEDTEGSAAWPIIKGREVAVAAGKYVTVMGSDANAKLYFYWI